MTPVPIPRRAVLTGLGALGLAGAVSACNSDAPAPITLETPPEDLLDPDVSSELQLIAFYTVVLETYPELSTIAAPIVAHHREHARALGADTSSASTTMTVPNSAQAALRQLIDAEERAAVERRDACLSAVSSERSRLLALIAASEASHARQLTDGDRGNA